MLMVWPSFLFVYLSVALTNATCDVTNADGDISHQNCSALIDAFNSCWEEESNIYCVKRSSRRNCLDDLRLKIAECPVADISSFLARLSSMMYSTDEIYCSLTTKKGFKNECKELARSTTLLQGRFMLDGYDTSEGCGYRIIYSLLNQRYSPGYEFCFPEMDSFRQIWYEKWPCKIFQNTSELYLYKTGKEISVKCLFIQSLVDDCFFDNLRCNAEQSVSWKCFEDALTDIELCNEPLLKLNIEHRAAAMMAALEFGCNSECSDLIRSDECLKHFNMITMYSAAGVKEFHSEEFCNSYRQNFLDIIALTSPLNCQHGLKEFSDYMHRVANCDTINETITQILEHHMEHENSTGILNLNIYFFVILLCQVIFFFG